MPIDCQEAFEDNTRRLALVGKYDPGNELRKKPNGEYAETRIYSAWCGWRDCWNFLKSETLSPRILELLQEISEEKKMVKTGCLVPTRAAMIAKEILHEIGQEK